MVCCAVVSVNNCVVILRCRLRVALEIVSVADRVIAWWVLVGCPALAEPSRIGRASSLRLIPCLWRALGLLLHETR